jgi:hypothetical protein
MRRKDGGAADGNQKTGWRGWYASLQQKPHSLTTLWKNRLLFEKSPACTPSVAPSNNIEFVHIAPIWPT